MRCSWRKYFSQYVAPHDRSCSLPAYMMHLVVYLKKSSASTLYLTVHYCVSVDNVLRSPLLAFPLLSTIFSPHLTSPLHHIVTSHLLNFSSPPYFHLTSPLLTSHHLSSLTLPEADISTSHPDRVLLDDAAPGFFPFKRGPYATMYSSKA